MATVRCYIKIRPGMEADLVEILDTSPVTFGIIAVPMPPVYMTLLKLAWRIGLTLSKTDLSPAPNTAILGLPDDIRNSQNSIDN